MDKSYFKKLLFENRRHIFSGILFRILMTTYCAWHDRTFPVPFTDVDYYVFTDAAYYITINKSPYERATYRYPPLIAWLLTLNLYLHPAWGKILFCLFDLLSGLLSTWIAVENGSKGKLELLLGLYNPFSVIIAARGNSDGLIAFIVLATLMSTMKKQALLAGLLLGLAIHLRIYPVIFSFGIFLAFGSEGKLWRKLLFYTKQQILLVASCILTLLFLTAVCYHFYGEVYFKESLLYHVTRRDIQHNYSIYFYLLYLNPNQHFLLLFLPQLLLLTTTSVLFHHPKKLAFGFFAEIFIFVTFNPVVTSQYWVWCFSLLPCCFAQIGLNMTSWGGLAALWLLPQVAWLIPAYLLEFRGRNTYVFVFLQCVGVFCVNIAVLIRLIRYFRKHGKLE